VHANFFTAVGAYKLNRSLNYYVIHVVLCTEFECMGNELEMSHCDDKLCAIKVCDMFTINHPKATMTSGMGRLL